MKKKVGIGIQDFSKIIENECFYIDKTYFIKEWWESGDKITIITRPRRFGKTLNMSMLEYFFSLQYEARSDLFEGLFIWKEKKYRKLQGTYPVISLSFANVKENTFEGASYRIRQILSEKYIKYYFLMKENIFSEDEKNYYKRMAGKMEEDDVPMALYHLSYYLYRYYGKKVIILLDEYDTPMLEARENGYVEELKTLMSNFFDFSFRKNFWMERGIMIGITKANYEPMFVQLNEVSIADIMSDQYALSFGFTEEEVFEALDRYDLGEEKEKVKQWYDGFIFGNHQSIYNPWCIAMFLDERRYRLYWAETSTNGLIEKVFRQGSCELKISLGKLLQGEHIWCHINENLLDGRLDDNEDSIWRLLVVSGYMKIVSKKIDMVCSRQKGLYELTFVNLEIRKMFSYMVRKWFNYVRSDYEDFVKSMLNHKVDDMNAYLERAVLNVFDYFDNGKGTIEDRTQRFYYSLAMALMMDLNNQYNFISYYEYGIEEYDVILEPKNSGDKAYILGFKAYEGKNEEALEDAAQMVFERIEEKQYAKMLYKKGILKEKIFKYAFVFNGKKVWSGGY